MKSIDEDLIKNADIQKIAAEGSKIYDSIKADYEPQKKGQFLAIDIDSQEVYVGSTSAEAVELARQHHPHQVFYVVKIGYDVAESVAKSFLGAF